MPNIKRESGILLTVQDAEAKTGIKKSELLNAIADSVLYGKKFGNFIMIPPAALEAYLDHRLWEPDDDELLKAFGFELKGEYSAKEMSQVLPLKLHTIQDMLTGQHLYSIKRGKARFVPRPWLAAWLRSRDGKNVIRPREISDAELLRMYQIPDQKEYTIRDLVEHLPLCRRVIQTMLQEGRLLSIMRDGRHYLQRHNMIHYLRDEEQTLEPTVSRPAGIDPRLMEQLQQALEASGEDPYVWIMEQTEKLKNKKGA